MCGRSRCRFLARYRYGGIVLKEPTSPFIPILESRREPRKARVCLSPAFAGIQQGRSTAMAKMYRVYSIIPRERQDDYWLNIGVAFPHEDGKGFNVMLQALPMHGNGKIVLREHEAKEGDTDEPAAGERRNASQDRNGGGERSQHREQRKR